MNAFKESGGIDYSADVLLGLQARGAGRPGFSIDEEKRKDPRELELKILKNRFAALGRPIPFRYYPAFSYFEEGEATPPGDILPGRYAFFSANSKCLNEYREKSGSGLKSRKLSGTV